MNISFNWNVSMLQKLQDVIEVIKSQPSIPISDIMTDDFVHQHSSFYNFQSLVSASGIKYPEELSDEPFSKFIATHTTFRSWDEMKSNAGTEYIKRKLGL